MCSCSHWQTGVRVKHLPRKHVHLTQSGLKLKCTSVKNYNVHTFIDQQLTMLLGNIPNVVENSRIITDNNYIMRVAWNLLDFLGLFLSPINIQLHFICAARKYQIRSHYFIHDCVLNKKTSMHSTVSHFWVTLENNECKRDHYWTLVTKCGRHTCLYPQAFFRVIKRSPENLVYPASNSNSTQKF